MKKKSPANYINKLVFKYNILRCYIEYISADLKYKCMYSIYSPALSKYHLILEQQNKLLISPVRVIFESKRVIFEPEWISKDNQT